LGVHAPESATADEEAPVVNLVRAAASCRDLRVLTLPLAPFTDHLDKALAFCIRINTQLEELTMSYKERPPGDLKIAALAFLEAMKTNFTIKHVRLKCVDFSFQARDAWSSDTRQNIEMIIRLNRVGRSYLTTEPTTDFGGAACWPKSTAI
jgi:hypothetical protein